MRKPGGVMVLRSGCAHWVSFWGVVAHVVKVVRVVGDGVAVVVRPDVVRGVVAHGVRLPGSLAMAWRLLCTMGVVLGVVAHGVELLRSGRGCDHLPGLKRSGRVVCFESYTLLIYTYNTKTNYFDIKTKFSLFLFGSIKICMYLCSRNNNKTN